MKTYLVTDCDRKDEEQTEGQVRAYLVSIGCNVDYFGHGPLEGDYIDATGDEVQVVFWDDK